MSERAPQQDRPTDEPAGDVSRQFPGAETAPARQDAPGENTGDEVAFDLPEPTIAEEYRGA